MNSVNFRANNYIILDGPKESYQCCDDIPVQYSIGDSEDVYASSESQPSENSYYGTCSADCGSECGIFEQEEDGADGVVGSSADSDDSDAASIGFNLKEKDRVLGELKNFMSKLNKANNDVKFLTVFSSAALFLGLLYKGNKVAAPIVRATVTAGETVSKGVVNVAGKVFKNIDTDKINNRIAKKAETIRLDAPDEKMLGGIKSFVNKIFPSHAGKVTNGVQEVSSGDKVVNVIKGLGIKNRFDVLKNLVVGAVAVGVTDRFADKVEGKLDEAEINKAESNLISSGINVAADIISAAM